jgi:predicted ferric reductase
MSPQLAWYVARAAGLVAWALTAAAVIWGLLLSTRITGRRPAPAWLADLHRYLGGLAVTFTTVHIGALLADTWVQFDVVDVLIPFASQWRPAAVAWGVVAMYLLAAVEITSLLRRRLPTRWWRAIHLSSFALLVAGTIHLLAAGTDAASPWLRALVAVTVTTTVYLTAVRLLAPRRRRMRSPHPPGRTAMPDAQGRARLAPSAAGGAAGLNPASRRPTIRSGR